VVSPPLIDLHTHSTASDGTDTPEQLVAAAHRAGVDVLAITDHDTTGGWDAAAAALPTGMRLVRGAEFSCVSPTGREERPVSVHLLGYLFDPTHPAIVAEQSRLRDERVHRLARITEKMAADGYPVDVESVMLDQSQMRAITGAGESLTVVPSMDGKVPVDVSDLMNGTPKECQWYFAETQTFGPEVEEFHKTTFQNPPDGGLISEGAAAYRDPETARHAFADLVGRVYDCGSTELGSTFIGEWTADADTLRMRSTGTCGRDYRIKNVVLAEVSFCSFPESIPAKSCSSFSIAMRPICRMGCRTVVSGGLRYSLM